MLSKAQRFVLRKHKDFFQTARRVFFPQMTVWVISVSGVSQAAVIVPKKVCSTAVGRNRMKRKLHILLSPLLQAKSGVAVVLSVKKKLSEPEYLVIKQDIIKVLDSLT